MKAPAPKRKRKPRDPWVPANTMRPDAYRALYWWAGPTRLFQFKRGAWCIRRSVKDEWEAEDWRGARFAH